MAEMILPGTYIEVRPEGLIVPGRVTVGNIGIVGTASKGPIEKPVTLGSYVEARQKFGDYDAWIDGDSDELTMVRALELVFGHGATTVVAMRVSGFTVQNGTRTLNAKSATYLLSSPGGDCVTLTAKSEGTWGNNLQVKVSLADEPAIVEGEEHDGGTINLAHTPVLKNARNRVRLSTAADGLTRSLQILYKGDEATPGVDPDNPTTSQVTIDRDTGELKFSSTLDPADKVITTYIVAPKNAANEPKAIKVTLKLDRSEEVYTVVSGDDLVADINRSPGGSAWVTATPDDDNSSELPAIFADFGSFGTGTNTAGDNGSITTPADYKNGIDLLLNEDAHIIIAAGQSDSFGDELNSHCQTASTDAIRRDRIGVIGSALGTDLDTIRGHNLDSDRVIFVAPGILATDAPSGKEVTLPGAYAAAAIAGLLASLPAHVSLTNKPLSVGGLERKYTNAELTQLVQSRVLALEQRQGFRIVKGITTSTNTAWHQITTRRIVDYAKFGVRSAANPYIGLLNNERVRGALKSTINSFLLEMVSDEMLVSYELDVTATRDDERRGIVQVTMVLRPVFSIDFIKVTMFLE